MSKVYLCIKEDLNSKYDSHIITDESVLSMHIKNLWKCYLLNGITEIESVETTVIEKME